MCLAEGGMKTDRAQQPSWPGPRYESFRAASVADAAAVIGAAARAGAAAAFRALADHHFRIALAAPAPGSGAHVALLARRAGEKPVRAMTKGLALMAFDDIAADIIRCAGGIAVTGEAADRGDEHVTRNAMEQLRIILRADLAFIGTEPRRLLKPLGADADALYRLHFSLRLAHHDIELPHGQDGRGRFVIASASAAATPDHDHI